MKTEELFSKIYTTAQKCGYEIYVVGGYVRDLLLGKHIKDIDFVVVGDAMVFADQLKHDLRLRRLVRYPRFGTFMASYYSYTLEFVNARSESYSQDSRKPITQKADLYSDLSRRDFTINTLAMSIDPKNFGQIIDRFGGKRDLENKLIRTPLAPEQTFSDDPLRMMRAIRFASRLNFAIHEPVWEAIRETCQRLQIVAQERITDEFNKILLSDNPSSGLRMLDESGLLAIFLPELQEMKGVEQRNKYHHKDVFYHTLEVVDNIARQSKDLKLRLAALFHDIGKPKTRRFDDKTGWSFHGHEIVGGKMVGTILRRMRYPSETIAYVRKLTHLHLRPMVLVSSEVTDSAIRRLLFLAGDEINDLMTLCRADITSKNPKRVKKYLSNYDNVMEKIAKVEERDRIRNFKPPVDGHEIMKMFGLQPGPQIGRIKKFLEEAIMNGEVNNDHDACVDFLNTNKLQLMADL